MWVQKVGELVGWSQESLGGDERGNVMPAASVEHNLLIQIFDPVKWGEPDPSASVLADVDVGEVLQSLSSKPSHVINEDGVIRVILR